MYSVLVDLSERRWEEGRQVRAPIGSTDCIRLCRTGCRVQRNFCCRGCHKQAYSLFPSRLTGISLLGCPLFPDSPTHTLFSFFFFFPTPTLLYSVFCSQGCPHLFGGFSLNFIFHFVLFQFILFSFFWSFFIFTRHSIFCSLFSGLI